MYVRTYVITHVRTYLAFEIAATSSAALFSRAAHPAAVVSHSVFKVEEYSVADKKWDSHFDDDDDDDNDEIDDAKNFSAPRKFSKKKFGATRSISSKNHENRSHPRDF